MAVELPEGTLILSIPSDKSIARTLGASQTDREDEKTLSKRQIAVALGAQAPTESSKTAFRIGAFVASINAALAVKTPRNLSFNAATKTLTWDKPSWALTTFYRVEKRVQPLLSSPEGGFNDLAARTSATSLVDNAYDSTLNTEYKVWPIAAMEEDQIAQPALLHIRTPGSPLITVAIECPHPLFPGSAATLSATVVGVPPQTPVVWFWKTDVGTLLPNATNPRPSATRSNAENPVLHIPADTTAEEVLISVEPLTYGLDNLYHGIRCPIMQKTLTIDLTFAPFPSGSNPNFLYGGRPVALRTAVGGTVAQSTAAPRIVYTITHGTLSLSQREAGTGTELTVNGYDQVWWHRPPVPSLGTNRRIATLVTGTATVFLEGLEASDTERCFLEWPPPPAFLTAEITGGSDIREGTANTQVLTCTPRGTAIGDVTYDWLAPTLGTLGTSADGNSASTVTYTAPANVDADTSVTITCRVRRQGLETLASTTFKVTNEATLTLDFGLFEGVLEYPNAIEYGTSYQCRAEVGGSATGSVDYRWVVFAAVAATGRASGVFTDTNTRQSTGIRPSVTTPATNVTGLSEFMEINLRVRKYASGSSGQRLSKTLTKRYSLRGTVPPPTPPPPPDRSGQGLVDSFGIGRTEPDTVWKDDEPDRFGFGSGGGWRDLRLDGNGRHLFLYDRKDYDLDCADRYRIANHHLHCDHDERERRLRHEDGNDSYHCRIAAGSVVHSHKRNALGGWKRNRRELDRKRFRRNGRNLFDSLVCDERHGFSIHRKFDDLDGSYGDGQLCRIGVRCRHARNGKRKRGGQHHDKRRACSDFHLVSRRRFD